jgi:hypothetical protein
MEQSAVLIVRGDVVDLCFALAGDEGAALAALVHVTEQDALACC